MRAQPPNRRNVKSSAVAATDAHERRKEFLNGTEIIRLLQPAKEGRHGVRDHLPVLMMYRHGVRASEAIDPRRDEVDLDRSRVRRLKSALHHIFI